eukprot:TRINITY_DN57116_c0_g1_i1.p1 TRINITY_DN57116_c0_g1~~TRINITY_DN57116_c0_g1_i1.p1  ORF type:complete len:1773 (-),score=328.93 TRINITY_DN57116_c0_g1_i1:34-5352(-)
MASSSWSIRASRLPEVGPLGFQSLAAGCGISADEASRWVVVWCGHAVSWLPAPGGGVAGRIAGLDAGGHYFERHGPVKCARLIPEARSLVVLFEDGSRTIIRCQAGGLCTEINAMPLEVGIVDAWPIFRRGVALFSGAAGIRLATLADEGLNLAPPEQDEEPLQVFATTLRHSRTTDETRSESLAVLAGWNSSTGTVLRTWLLDDGKVLSSNQLLLCRGQIDGQAGGRADATQRVVSLSVLSGCRSIAILFDDGRLMIVCRAETSHELTLSCNMSGHHVAGLRLCASGGLDVSLLQHDVEQEAPASRACSVVACGDETLALLFPTLIHAGQDNPECGAEVLALQLDANSDLRPPQGEPISVLCAPGSNACCVAGFVSTGSALFSLVRKPLADDEGMLARHHILCSLHHAASQPLDSTSHGVLARYRQLLGMRQAGAERFAEAVLEFDPFPCLSDPSKAGNALFGCEQLRRLLGKAQSDIEAALSANGVVAASTSSSCLDVAVLDILPADDSGWGSLDLEDLPPVQNELSLPATSKPAESEAVSVFRQLHQRVVCQQGRLAVLQMLLAESGEASMIPLVWASFREMEAAALRALARQLAAEQRTAVLEALFSQQPQAFEVHWEAVLNALPETVEVQEVQKLLPGLKQADSVLWVSDAGIDWYFTRARSVLERTGLCRLALDLLQRGICNALGVTVPVGKSGSCVADLPAASASMLQAMPNLPLLYGLFRLIAEFDRYSHVIYEEQLDNGWPRDEPPPQTALSLMEFCALTHGERACLALKRSRPGTVVADAQAWVEATCLEHCLGASASSGVIAAPAEHGFEAACLAAANPLLQPVEEGLMQALLGRLTSSGWDPASFQVLAEVVVASSPGLPPENRLIKAPLRLLEFILSAVYGEDQRCHAVDIFGSVDTMYACIPKPNANISASQAAHWATMQQQADDLEKHLTCVELLVKHKINLALSFADLRRGCSNENMALHSLWNLFRVLGAKYRPALFWRNFKDELFYLHKHAFAAVSTNSVYDMYMRCLVEQEHFDVLTSVVESWTSSCGSNAVGSCLVNLAKELVNSSPALKHSALEKARRVLKCVTGAASESSKAATSELDFVKACELLHELVRRKPKRSSQWVQSAVQAGLEDLRSGATFAHLSQDLRNIKFSSLAHQASRVTLQVEAFCVETPVQLRLRLQKPLRVITNLLEFNPPVLLESEDLHKFCSLIGLVPTSESWAEVMALCGAAHLLCGDNDEALSITEKLLVNAHPGSWKLALALAAETKSVSPGTSNLSLDCTSALLADAAKVCPDEDLPRLLSFFSYGPPGGSKVGVATLPVATSTGSDARETTEKARGYCSDIMRPSLAVEAERTLHSENAESSWKCLKLWEGASADEWLNRQWRQHWGQQLLSMDKDAAATLLDDFCMPRHAGVSMEGTNRVQLDAQNSSGDGRNEDEKDIDPVYSSTGRGAEGHCADILPDPNLDDDWLEPEIAPAAALAVNSGSTSFVETERATYPQTLPALRDPESTRSVVSWAAEDCRHILDMCAELVADGGGSGNIGFQECPEIEPDQGWSNSLTSPLQAVHEACPDLDISHENTELASEVLRRASSSSSMDALRLARAVSGVSELGSAGASPSAIALRAAQRSASFGGETSSELAPLMPLLAPNHCLEFLSSTMRECTSRSKKLEIIAHLRSLCEQKGGGRASAVDEEWAWAKLEGALRQAEALCLLQSIFENRPGLEASCSFELNAELSLEAARRSWLQQIQESEAASPLLDVAEALLDTGFG